ncbi:MAG TPA: alkaline phosphatase D family protein [Kofleriaceae bacterium]|nr:alkaline phosphatase D family protein [Kofleriaceae bacterium]
MTPTRRDVLRWGGLGTAALVTGCGDNDLVRDPGTQLATAIVEPESDSFLVAVWAELARDIALEVQVGDTTVLQTAATLDAARRATFDVGGLAPGSLYRVRALADTGAELVHHVRTAPSPDDTRPVRIAVSADVDPYPEFDSELVEHVIAASPDVFVSIGDFPYTDNGPPAMTLDTYRTRHVEARTSQRVRRLLTQMGLRAIYDDHEFRNDWDAMYRETEADRYVAAMQAWDEFFPLRRTDIRYRSWRWGAHVECFLLDTRQFRSANAARDNDAKTMLGETQLAWLLDGVRASTAPFKLVFTSVPLDFGDGNDHWSSFTTERARMFDAFAGVPGVLFVSADQHWFAAHRHERGIREFQVGPISRGIGTPMRTADGVLFRHRAFNVGLVDIDGESLTFSGLGADGTVFYKETLTVEDLTPAT